MLYSLTLFHYLKKVVHDPNKPTCNPLGVFLDLLLKSATTKASR